MPVIGGMIYYAILASEGILKVVLGLFGRQLWFLCPLVLAMAFYRHERKKNASSFVFLYVTIAVILLLGLISPHRSRPLYAIGIVASVSWVYGQFRRVVAFVSVPVAIAVIALAILGLDRVPMLFTRSLSIFLPIPESQIESYVRTFESSPERGWSSSFRGGLYEVAWRQIRQHPLAGKGFVFSNDEIMWAISPLRTPKDSAEALAVSGCYHNSLLELAVFCGVPAATILFIAVLGGIRRFLRAAPLIRDPHMKILSAGTLGFAIAEIGQTLINGASYDVFFVCAALGALHGVCLQTDGESATASPGLAPDA